MATLYQGNPISGAGLHNTAPNTKPLYIIERNNRYAVSISPNCQVWSRSKDSAQTFTTYGEAESTMKLAKVRARITTIIPEPTTKPITYLTPASGLVEIPLCVEKITNYIPDDLKDYPATVNEFISQWLTAREISDPGELPIEY